MTSRCPRCTLLGFTLSALLHLGAAAVILTSGTTREIPLVDGHRVAVNLAMFEGPSERQAPTADVDGTGEPPGNPKANPEPNPSAEREQEPEQTPEPATEPDSEEEPETVSVPTSDAAPKPAMAPELNATPNPKLPVAPPALSPKRKTSPVRTTQPIPKPKSKPKLKPKPKPKLKSEAKSKYAGKARSPSGRTEEQSGSADARGLSGSAAASAKGGGKEGRANAKALESQYLAGLQRAIAKKRRFPSSARRRGETGVVRVSFVLAQSGRISGARVDKSSGSARLDRAALDTLKRLGRYKPIPKALGRTSWRLRVPIRFTLE